MVTQYLHKVWLMTIQKVLRIDEIIVHWMELPQLRARPVRPQDKFRGSRIRLSSTLIRIKMPLLTDNHEGADALLIFLFCTLLSTYNQFVVNFEETKNICQRTIWSEWLSKVATSPSLNQVDPSAQN